MGTARTRKHTELTTGVRICVGIMLAVIVTILFALLLSFAISAEKIQDSNMGVYSKVIWALSSAVGCIAGVTHADKQKLLKGAIIAAGYVLMLLIISAIAYQVNIGEVMAAILCATLGCLVVCGLKSKGKSATKRKWK